MDEPSTWQTRLADFRAAVVAAAIEVRHSPWRPHLLGWRIINIVVIVLLVPGVLVYLFAPLVLITSEPALTVTLGVLPWIAILMLIYAVFLAFMVVGFVGALFRSLTLFKSYLIMLVAMLIITIAFFSEVLLLFYNAFNGGQFTVSGVGFTCGSNETILILSVIDHTTGDPIPSDLWFGNSTLLGFDGSAVGAEYCNETRHVLIIVLIVLGIIMPLICCGPCIYAGVRYFKELSDDKHEYTIDLIRNPFGGNDPLSYDMPGSGPPDTAGLSDKWNGHDLTAWSSQFKPTLKKHLRDYTEVPMDNLAPAEEPILDGQEEEEEEGGNDIDDEQDDRHNNEQHAASSSRPKVFYV